MKLNHLFHANISHMLSAEQTDELSALILSSRVKAGCPLYADQEDCREDFGFPRFFFYYNENRNFVHATWISVLSEKEWNLFSFTHPDYRRKGYFHEALLQVKKELSSLRTLPDIYIPVSPENEPAKTALRQMRGEISYCDYLMEIDPHMINADTCHSPCVLIQEELMTQDDGKCLIYHLRTSKSDFFDAKNRRKVHGGAIQEIGSCLITQADNNVCFLSHVEIKKRYRNRGFGTILVSLVLQQLAKHQHCTVRLHTDSRNVPAVKLYRKLGFEVSQQIDMWKILI